VVAIPEEYLDLFQKKVFAELATLMPNGSPQMSRMYVYNSVLKVSQG